GASHHWVREIRKTDSVVTLSAGHDVILFPAQHVKAYHQKNDYNDVQAIAEACNMQLYDPYQ
ncbi:TPA: hypothetical protein ACH5PM_005020, partial [Escherichia coli]